MSFGKYKVRMDDGTIAELDIDQELLIGDVSEDMDKVAAQIAFWGRLWGEAEARRINTDGSYRNWAANMGKKILAQDPKIAEWKAKDITEASKDFVTHKGHIAQATLEATTLRSIVDAFKSKASLLQSKGAMMRAELDATGMSTKAAASEARREQLTDGVRKTFKKGGGKS